MTVREKKKAVLVIVVIKKHAKRKHATTPNKTYSTKCVKTLIRHHGVDI